jgi:hypothetical protein
MLRPEVNEKYKDKLKEELSYVFEDVEVLSEENVEDLPKVYEDDFKEYLLPYMLDLVDKSYEENSKAFFNNWVNLAGDVLKPFVVVDSYGSILFKVPRYLARYDDETTPISDISYITILKEFRSEYERFPEKAEQELIKTTETIASMFKINKESVREIIEFYINIRKRYNDYYTYYKSNQIKEEITLIEEHISKFKQKIEEAIPESSIYYELNNKIEKLNKEKDKLIEELSKLGYGYSTDVKESNSKTEYEDIDYED